MVRPWRELFDGCYRWASIWLSEVVVRWCPCVICAASLTCSFCPCPILLFVTAELCALSEYRIYPGNGKLMIRRDGKPIWLGSSKAFSLTIQRKKAAKLVWTQAWRRLHKKGLSETTTKKRTRRANKVQRAVVGASLEDIRKRATEKSSVRTAAREAALKEMKAKKATTKKGGKSKAKTFEKVPKHMARR